MDLSIGNDLRGHASVSTGEWLARVVFKSVMRQRRNCQKKQLAETG
jgi:hypothetical protein